MLKAATSSAGNSYAVRHTANDAEALQPAANGWSIGNASFSGTTSNNTTTWTADAGSKALVMHIAAAARSPHVTNLGTTTTTGSAVSTTTSQSVAVTTGANSGGYTLTSVEIPLKQTTAGGVTVALHADASGDPAASAVANAAFTGTAPTGTSSFTDTTFTCAGTGCDLAGGTGGTKYHIVVTASSGAYEWRNSSSNPTETTVPTGSGWDIGDSHSKTGSNWAATTNHNLVRADFAFKTSLDVTAGPGENTATLTLTGHEGGWWYQADGSGPLAVNCHRADGASLSFLALTKRTTYTITAYSNDTCTTSLANVKFTTTGAALSFTNVTSTTATLNIDGHTAQWWYKADASPDNTCQGPVAAGTSTESLTGLTSGSTYVYTAYKAANCGDADEIAEATVTLVDVAVSNLGETSVQGCPAGVNNTTVRKCAAGFTTGANSAGYTLKSVTADFQSKGGSPGDLIVALHAASTSNSDHPAATALATLSGANPADDGGRATFTCSGSGCDLTASTTYFIVMSTADTSGSGDNSWWWDGTNSDAETLTPTGNGWSLANGGVADSGSGWAAMGSRNQTPMPMMQVGANNKAVTLTASNIAATTATLTIAGHTGAWYYKANNAPHTTCSASAVSGASTNLTGLAAGTSYVYTAYSNSGCTTLLAQESFTTLASLTASSVTGTGATLTIAGQHRQLARTRRTARPGRVVQHDRRSRGRRRRSAP